MDYVSIVIVTYSNVDDFGEARSKGIDLTRSQMMKMSIESLRDNTDYPAEIILVDNGGNPDDSDWLVQKQREGVINVYIRNKNNMHFGYARMQGIKLATGNFLAICDNDIYYKPNWLSKTIEPLLKFPDKKFIASPFLTPEKTKGKNPRPDYEGYRVNSMAGSNCMVMRREVFTEIGDFSTSHITGSHWHRRMNKYGYVVIIPPEDYATHLAWRKGYDLKKQIKVKEILLNGDEIDYSFEYRHG